jgi:UDP-N-acetylglucosamine--N-acetylmuramyl-(pentapeptide) pyrophosphoryl-undecaprenol N-acetylglucosamine transferase
LAAAVVATIPGPRPTATDDHQRRNAEAFVRHGAAVMVEQSELSGERLAAQILALATDASRRAQLAAAAKALARPNAAAVIVDRVLDLVRR